MRQRDRFCNPGMPPTTLLPSPGDQPPPRGWDGPVAPPLRGRFSAIGLAIPR
jgi:hypothetical protein